MLLFDNLPDEIKIKIVLNNNATTLARLARVSKNWYCLAEDNYLWKSRLIEDFHIPAKSAELLQKCLDCGYKQVYRYWQQYYPKKPWVTLLNYNLQNMLRMLKAKHSIEIKPEYFYHRPWFDSFYHVNALCYLMTVRHLSINESLIEMDKIDADGAYLLSQGMTREEMCHLNYVQMATIIDSRKEWFNQGLTVNQLRESGNWFNTEEHKLTFLELIHKKFKNLTPAEALVEIQGLNSEQVKSIRKQGFSRNDVAGLNHLQLGTLIALHQFGLKSDALRHRNWSNSVCHHALLMKLVEGEHKAVNDALSAVNQLTEQQAKNILRGDPKDKPAKIKYQMSHQLTT